MKNYIENKTFNEINIGDSATLKRTVSMEDIELFASISGDVNPAHVDFEFAKNDIFHRVVAHGMWGASLISTVLGTILPGPGTIYLEQNLKFLHPISPGDIVTVTVTAIEKTEIKHKIIFDCTCKIKHDVVAISGIASVMAPTEKIKREKVSVPTFIVKTPYDKLYKDLCKNTNCMAPIKVGVVYPTDELSLMGALESAVDKIIEPILIGPAEQIHALAKQHEISLSGYKIIDAQSQKEAAQIGIHMARNGDVDALMKGYIHTDELMSLAVNEQNGIRTHRRMSHVAALEVPGYEKPLFLTDAAINLFPSLEDKVDIVQNAIDLFRALGFGTPKVAIVSAAETVNDKIPSTLDAAALCKMADRGQIVGGILDGPLALDDALSKESVKVKKINSSVAGDADIIVTPDVESGNMLYKQMTYSSQIEAACIVMGAMVPIILTSRAGDVKSRKMSSLMALAYVRNKNSIIDQ